MHRRMMYVLAVVMLGLIPMDLAYGAVPDLLAWWKCDEGSGTAVSDASGNGRDGTFVNGSPAWVTGIRGNAVQLVGPTVVEVQPLNMVLTQATMAGWIKPNGPQPDWSSFIMTRTPGLATGFNILGYQLAYHWNDAANSWSYRGGDMIAANDWTFAAVTIEPDKATFYVNGVPGSVNRVTHGACTWNSNIYLGGDGNANWVARRMNGALDDVSLFGRALTAEEIKVIMKGIGGYPYASSPSPANGVEHADTWITLSWRAGDYAVSHNVYLGDKFDDVNTGASAAFRGNQTLTYYVAGFPGFAYPDGLVPGTTYYWRIDEVNTAEPNSPWKGPVWSFKVPPKKAYNPSPADGAKFIALDATLSWTAGFGTKLHTIYFGENRDTVANAAGGVPQAATTYKPTALKAGTTYYWRIDEFDGSATHKGDVWSFVTAKAGGGVKGQYYKGMNFESLVLTRTDPQINFAWGNNAPDPIVGADGFSVRWTGEVEAAFTETYTFYTNSDDGVRLWVDGQQLVNNWTDHGTTEDSGKINLVAGNTYSLQMEMYENGGGAVAELRWSSPRTPKQLIPQAAFSPPVKASAPKPGNGATGVSLTPVLTWNAGDFAASHEVYLGVDAQAVKSATKTSAEYKGSKAKGSESYSPGKLAWKTTYYWRVDEVNSVNPNSPWVGNVWSFTTGDFLLIDDFESYNSGTNQIWYTWHDGLGYGAPGTPGYFAGNGTGAAVGDENTTSFTEQTIVHGGKQAMPVAYDNNKQGKAKYSEVEYKLTTAKDWTEENVGELSIWFRGLPGSVGSFTEAPAGTFTMTGSGADIWDLGTAGNYHDEFHFAYKTLTGAGSIVAQVQSVQNTNGWAKAGVMIRQTLDGGSPHMFAAITPSNGVAQQGRPTPGAASFNANQTGITAPRWLKLDRDLAGNFTVSHSANGTTWTAVTGATPQNIQMGSNVYIGLAVTAHNATATCQAVFTNVTITGTVSPQWAHQDIGISSNAAEPLYVAVSNAAGQPAVIVHPDPKAAQIMTWTEWVIPLKNLQGITLNSVDKLAIGMGTRGNQTTPGGSGKMYIDDIRLYRPRTP